MKQVHIFSSAIVCAQPDQVAFIAGNVDQFVLAKKSEDRGVSLTNNLASLNRNGNVSVIAKIEADDGMRNPWRAPIRERDVDAPQLREVEDPRFPVAMVVELSFVIAVAQIVYGHTIAIDLSP